MPVYNAVLYLKEAIDSILRQSYRDFELLIINDGSTDQSLSVIEAFSDPRIRVINNKSNQGIIASRNIGLQFAKGEYIANMDADDISLPDRFERQVAFLDGHPEICIVASRLVLIDRDNNAMGVWPEDHFCVREEDILRTLPIVNCIGQPTTMMRANVIKKIGYNARFKNNEDWGLWLQTISMGYRVAKLPQVLLKYRQHATNTTRRANELGVEKKVISFKFRYLFYKLSGGGFRRTDKRVLLSVLRDLLRFCVKRTLPRIYQFLQRYRTVNTAIFIRQFKETKKQLNAGRTKYDLIYVFPYFHLGGAERVHASILEATEQIPALTLITGKSDNRAFYSKFSEHSTVLEIDELLKLGVSERWLFRKVRKLCSANSKLKVFGCNSRFLYDLVPFLPFHTVVMDLLHAFVHDYESGPEKWSLPVVERIGERVVISAKTKGDLAALYLRTGLSESLISRIRVIPNYVESIPLLKVKDSDYLRVAYVGRGGEEKRVGLIARVANNLHGKYTAIQFHFVGDLKEIIPEELREACVFHKEVLDPDILRALYDQFHILLIASTREGFPLVIMEAMMQGVVPISTPVGGIPEHIKDGVNGLLVYSTAEEDLTREFEEKIKYLYQHRNDLMRLSVQAHRYALATFSKQAFFESYSSLLGEDKHE